MCMHDEVITFLNQASTALVRNDSALCQIRNYLDSVTMTHLSPSFFCHRRPKDLDMKVKPKQIS